MLPRARRAASAITSAGTASFSALQISVSFLTMSRLEMRRKSKRCTRERIVSGSLAAAVVAKMNFTCGGGSSSVLRSALKAGSVSMWTSSM